MVLKYLKNSYFCIPRSIFTTVINYPPLGRALDQLRNCKNQARNISGSTRAEKTTWDWDNRNIRSGICSATGDRRQRSHKQSKVRQVLG